MPGSIGVRSCRSNAPGPTEIPMSTRPKPYSPEPFRIAVPDATLVDLKKRLQDVRWADEVVPGWDCGVDLHYLRSFVDYRRDDYDSRHPEATLNQPTHYTAQSDSITL